MIPIGPLTLKWNTVNWDRTPLYEFFSLRRTRSKILSGRENNEYKVANTLKSNCWVAKQSRSLQGKTGKRIKKQIITFTPQQPLSGFHGNWPMAFCNRLVFTSEMKWCTMPYQASVFGLNMADLQATCGFAGLVSL